MINARCGLGQVCELTPSWTRGGIDPRPNGGYVSECMDGGSEREEGIKKEEEVKPKQMQRLLEQQQRGKHNRQ